MKEYEVFSKVMYWIEQKYFQKYPATVDNEDSDVVDQKLSIKNSSEYQIKSNYILAIKDLTKYYKNFLAVNGLSLGVKKYECFGLLGKYYNIIFIIVTNILEQLIIINGDLFVFTQK